MKGYRFYSFLLVFLPFLFSYGEGFAPVRNFSRQVYGAGSQNWAVAQDKAGRLYFANRDGLLRYDGVRWSLYPLPNYTTVRSVFADDESGRVYVGGTGEFGYFHNDPVSHTLKYVSMVSLLPEGERSFTEIWNIHRIGKGGMVFQGDFRLFICRNDKIEIVESNEKITSSAVIGDRLYAGTQVGEIFQLGKEGLSFRGKTAGASRIAGLLPYNKDAVLIVTANEGLYSLNEKVDRLEWDINGFLTENQAFCASYNEETYAFGTVNLGAAVVDKKTGKTNFINKHTGLQDNTVLGMGFDFTGNLWLCLDNGIGYAMVESPVFNLLGNASEAGAGYAAMLKDKSLYLATNRGLFYTDYPFTVRQTPPALGRIHSGQVWSLDSIGNDLFVSADDGLYIMTGRSMPKKIDGISGTWYVAPLKKFPGKALVSSYNGFVVLSKEKGVWKVEGKIKGYDDAGGKFIENTDGTIWLAHWIKGVYRLRLSPDLSRFESVKLYTSKDGLPSERDNSLAMDNGKLIIATASGEFYTVGSDASFIKDEKLTRQIPLTSPAHYYPWRSGGSFVFSPKVVWKMQPDSKGNLRIDSVSLRSIANSLIPGFEHISFLNENDLIVSNQEGFYSVDLRKDSKGGWKNGVLIETLMAGDSIIFSGMTTDALPEVKLPFSQNSLTFNFAAPEYRQENGVLYSCMLEGYDKEWSTPSENAFKEYTQLGEGTYRLKIRALNTVTGETSETSFSFTISPPWYRSLWAKIVYAVLILLVLLLSIWTVRYLSQKNAAKIRDQKEKELENMRREAEKEAIKKDYEIASLKSNQLEQDIKHKSSELSNTTMNVIRKNEMLLDISNRLKKIYEDAEGDGLLNQQMKKEMDRIKKLIDENISHDDDWKKFNQNFDIVYADFTKHLTEKHPNLTISEKRLCCYLKMGLSSKEIAPIFNISPKSVEMNRYRLRKKMGLEREDNLVEYLQEF